MAYPISSLATCLLVEGANVGAHIFPNQRAMDRAPIHLGRRALGAGAGGRHSCRDRSDRSTPGDGSRVSLGDGTGARVLLRGALGIEWRARDGSQEETCDAAPAASGC